MKKALFLALVLVMVMSTTVTMAVPVDDNTAPYEIDVTVSASVNPKIMLSVDENTFNAGVLDPDLAAPQWTGSSVTVTTKSNVECTLSAALDAASTVNGVGQPTFTRAAWASQTDLIGDQSFVDPYEISVDYNVVPGNYQAIVQYTLVQE